MKDKFETTTDGFSFRRARGQNVISVLNGLSYLMAEYSDKTGVTSWRRVVPAGQREKVEHWLQEHYPVHASVR